MPGRELGDRGEALAGELLQRRGWEILHRNFRAGHKEVDLVARRGEVVAFVEVKTRLARSYGHPLEAIDPRKRREVETVAAVWIQEHGSPRDVYRFDAIAVTFAADGSPLLQHVEDAWGI